MTDRLAAAVARLTAEATTRRRALARARLADRKYRQADLARQAAIIARSEAFAECRALGIGETEIGAKARPWSPIVPQQVRRIISYTQPKEARRHD